MCSLSVKGKKMDGNLRENLIAIVGDVLADESTDLTKHNIMFEWTYPETGDVTYTLFIGPKVLESDIGEAPSLN